MAQTRYFDQPSADAHRHSAQLDEVRPRTSQLQATLTALALFVLAPVVALTSHR